MEAKMNFGRISVRVIQRDRSRLRELTLSIFSAAGPLCDGSAAAVSVHCLRYTFPIDATRSRLIQYSKHCFCVFSHPVFD